MLLPNEKPSAPPPPVTPSSVSVHVGWTSRDGSSPSIGDYLDGEFPDAEEVLSHLLGLLGPLLCVPGVHTSWLLRQRSEYTVDEGGRGRHSLVAGGQSRLVVVVPDDLAVGGRSSFSSRALLLLPRRGLLEHADAGMDAWGRSLQTESRRRMM